MHFIRSHPPVFVASIHGIYQLFAAYFKIGYIHVCIDSTIMKEPYPKRTVERLLQLVCLHLPQAPQWKGYHQPALLLAAKWTYKISESVRYACFHKFLDNMHPYLDLFVASIERESTKCVQSLTLCKTFNPFPICGARNSNVHGEKRHCDVHMDTERETHTHTPLGCRSIWNNPLVCQTSSQVHFVILATK